MCELVTADVSTGLVGKRRYEQESKGDLRFLFLLFLAGQAQVQIFIL